MRNSLVFLSIFQLENIKLILDISRPTFVAIKMEYDHLF